jgi:hypothetical protein
MSLADTATIEEPQDLLHVATSLVREFERTASAGAVITTVSRCRDELAAQGVRAGLATATEAMARRRLHVRSAR